jgi:two-component system, OmpR family, phosphate regulon response regulator PhoB
MAKLLIADDHEGIRDLVRITLMDDRYEIVEATDGDEALELAIEHKPDLIFLDVTMPKKSGLDVCRSLKSNPDTAESTIVMLTALGQDGDREAGLSAGADGYFTKPFSPVALLRKVDEVLEKSSR